MRRSVQLLLRALSNPEEPLDVIKSRQLMNLKAIDPLKKTYRTADTHIRRGEREIGLRLYFPFGEPGRSLTEEQPEKGAAAEKQSIEGDTCPVLLYIHGGGFATESVDSYNRVCWNLAKHTRHVVVAVDYVLAPEQRFPGQLEDCYAVAKTLFTERTILPADPGRITVMGDSAGGNLAAALSMLARDRGEFLPPRQILIYPCLSSDYSLDTPYRSVIENGSDYLLTRRNMEDYLELYQSSPGDRTSPYFAPLNAQNYGGLPKTLVITGEFDPLRDEGEEYARRLQRNGTHAVQRRIADGVHGYFLLPSFYPAVRETYGYINEFLSEDEERVSDEKKQMADP